MHSLGSRVRAPRRVVLLIASIVTTAVACGELITAPLPDHQLAPGSRTNDWACVSTNGQEWCEWFEPESGGSTWEPPPDWGGNPDPNGGGGYPYCDTNPEACGGSVNGGGPSDATAYADDTGLPTYDGDVDPYDEANEALFDCRRVKCPPPSAFRDSPDIHAASQMLMQRTQETGKEWGAWLYLREDGTIRVGPFLEGEPGRIPALRTPPNQYVIGSIHTHPPGSGTGISNPDMNNALMNGIYVVVRTVNNIYVYPSPSPTGWSGTLRTPHNCC